MSEAGARSRNPERTLRGISAEKEKANHVFHDWPLFMPAT
jgi:hypothetical protein